jgi:hypothetical protein
VVNERQQLLQKSAVSYKTDVSNGHQNWQITKGCHINNTLPGNTHTEYHQYLTI